jgi:Carboxypeptidase regulatory-like domain
MTQGSFKSMLAVCVVTLLAMSGSLAYGQGGATTSSLTGVVVDSSGAVIPGADVVLKNNATASEARAVSDATGSFTFPSMPPGTYTVTVSLMGFKTVVMPDVQLIAAQPARVTAKLEVGQLQETVTVTGATEIVQAESSSVATTLSTKQITSVPLPTRNTLDFVASLPGVNTTSTIRSSTVMGLQASATNITIDGINVQDNYLKSSDGFFSRISPRMDAVEEVSVSTANPGAESAGQGAVQIRFVTRSGTNKFQGSGYEYMRRPSFNTNYWFNIRDGLPKEQVKLDTYGGRIGGPIKKDKLFFFFNYEEMRQPGSVSRSRTMLTAQASTGAFTYCTNSPCTTTNTVNLLALAAANGQVATIDPTVQALLTSLQTAAGLGTTASTGLPVTQRLNFVNNYTGLRRYPTTRLDYNVTNNHRVGVSYYYQQYLSNPDTLNTYDPRFPGFPDAAGQNSNRWSWMANWRWTVSANMVNEVRGGLTGGPVKFGDGISRSIYDTGAFAGWNGFEPYPSTSLISQMFVGTSASTRDAPTQVLEDTFSWLKGKHSINIGASYTNVGLSYYNVQNAVPYLNFGVDTNDPANGLFTAGNFPGSASADLTNARNLYGFLTGRITGINGSAYLDGATGKYVYLGDAYQKAHERELGFYVQDSWKVRPDLTLSYGIRYELQMPFIMDNAYFSRPLTYCNTFGVSGCATDGLSANLFAPGSFNGQITQLRAFDNSEPSYNTPMKNWAPSVGVAWRPHVTGGWLQTILSADPVIRGGYSRAYTREGIYAVTALYGANPGGSVTASRNMSLGNLVASNANLPLLLSGGFSQLGPGSFPDMPSYPYTPTTSNSVNEFYPNSQTPYAHTFNVSFQRTLGKNTAVDVRYVGTRQYGGWWIGGRGLNEFNTIENGFLNEFQLAQANLAANIKAGKGNTFAYTGATGTAPLPIMLAWLNGSTAASTTGSYTGSAWTSSTLYGYLAKMNPNPQSFASYLQTASSAYATNASRAGLPSNFFVINPGVSSGGSWVTGRPEDAYNNRYDAMQIELRRRMSGGLLVQGSYQYVMRSDQTSFYTLRTAGQYSRTSVPKQSLKINWAYELPFGQGKPWINGIGRLGQMIVGGWSIDGNLRAQSGNILDFGNVRLVGMTDQQLQDEYYLRFVKDSAGLTRVYMLPDDIIQNTIKAFSYNATSTTGYGSLGAPTGRYFEPVSAADPLGNPTGCISGYSTQCTNNQALHHYVTGPAFFRTDIGISKRLDFTRRVWGDFRVDLLNVFNNVDFFGTTWSSTDSGKASLSGYEVSSAYRDSSNTQDPGGRIMQLSFRVSF